MKDIKNTNQHKEQNAKVIQFPGSKERATHVATSEHHDVTEQSWLSKLGVKKSIYGLASVVLVATVVNFVSSPSETSESKMMAQNSHGVQSRSLASVGTVARSLRDANFEKSLASKLSKMSSRDIASVGRVPTFEDRLRFEYLEGKYSVRMHDGKLKEIEFASSPDSPKYLNDRAGFIKSYKGLMPVSFDSAKSVSREVMPQKIYETYQLVQNDSIAGEVQFELDLYGRLISMKVETLKQ